MLFREDASTWVNVSNILVFLPQTNSDVIEFIISSEVTGWRHLYHVISKVNSPASDMSLEDYSESKTKPILN